MSRELTEMPKGGKVVVGNPLDRVNVAMMAHRLGYDYCLVEYAPKGRFTVIDIEAVVFPQPSACRRCDGEGETREFLSCTTFGPDCACNAPLVSVICPDCGGSGEGVIHRGPEDAA